MPKSAADNLYGARLLIAEIKGVWGVIQGSRTYKCKSPKAESADARADPTLSGLQKNR